MSYKLIKSLFKYNKYKNYDSGSFKKEYDYNQIQRYEYLLKRNGKSFKMFNSILEFGCGYGRLLEIVNIIHSKADIFGCDVSKSSIESCSKNIKNGKFVTNSIYPPLDYNDNSFDLIYTYSVFTHLSESNHLSWLKEFERLLKPGGYMIHSIKSYEFVKRALIFSPNSLGKYNLNNPMDKFENNHLYHYVIDNNSEPEYGLTIISRKYTEKYWFKNSKLSILDYAEGCIESYPEGCHDLVLISKN